MTVQPPFPGKFAAMASSATIAQASPRSVLKRNALQPLPTSQHARSQFGPVFSLHQCDGSLRQSAAPDHRHNPAKPEGSAAANAQRKVHEGRSEAARNPGLTTRARSCHKASGVRYSLGLSSPAPKSGQVGGRTCRCRSAPVPGHKKREHSGSLFCSGKLFASATPRSAP